MVFRKKLLSGQLSIFILHLTSLHLTSQVISSFVNPTLLLVSHVVTWQRCELGWADEQTEGKRAWLKLLLFFPHQNWVSTQLLTKQ